MGKQKSMGDCPVCRSKNVALEEHHLWPREYGGVDEETIDVCSSCHSSFHNAANSVFADSTEENDSPETYFTPEVWRRAAIYVKCIVKARQLYERVQHGENIVVEGRQLKLVDKRVMFHLDPETLVLLHMAKQDHGFTNMDKFMKAVAHKLTAKYRK